MRQFWIFGYGSLMWRPGFDYIRSAPALVRGYHRSLCVYSYVHRGTPEQPGLVLVLDRGGSCHGLGFEIAPERWEETIAYLRAREQVTMVYAEKQVNIRLLGTAQTVEAVTYAVDRKHRQYAGILPLPELVSHAVTGEGVSGRCLDYVMSTVHHLRDMKIHDATLESLAGAIEDQASMRSG